jgi:excisionase family DNA binding protein
VTGRQIVTPAQAAVLLGLGKTTVVEWCKRGILPAVCSDSRWYLKRAELIREGWRESQASGHGSTSVRPDVVAPDLHRCADMRGD